MAIRSVIATVGQPLEAAQAKRSGLFKAAEAERESAAAAAAEAAVAAAGAALSDNDDGGGLGTFVGAAGEALARELLEPLPLPYLPSVGALLLVMAAVAGHVLLFLGKKWSVRFHAW